MPGGWAAHFKPTSSSYPLKHFAISCLRTQTNFHLWSMKNKFFILRWCLRWGGSSFSASKRVRKWKHRRFEAFTFVRLQRRTQIEERNQKSRYSHKPLKPNQPSIPCTISLSLTHTHIYEYNGDEFFVGFVWKLRRIVMRLNCLSYCTKTSDMATTKCKQTNKARKKKKLLFKHLFRIVVGREARNNMKHCHHEEKQHEKLLYLFAPEFW